MIPILVCTVTGKSLPVLEASIKAYCPNVKLIAHSVERSTFGQSYNAAMEQAFRDYDEIIIANDDIVLTPSSYNLLLEDVSHLKSINNSKIGVVASRSDFVRPFQNIKNNLPDNVFPTLYVSPLFAWVSKEAFNTAKFSETNWFSDDMMCVDLNYAGFTNYVSRSYVHHAGSQTIGTDNWEMYLEAIDWIEKNRPDRLGIFKR